MSTNTPPPTALPAHTAALHGVVVLDFSHVIAGPFATFYLAALGARVIKVENPHRGDSMRSKPRGFEALNHGKEVVRLDLGSDEGQARAWALFAEADVVVDNMRPGVLERFGFGEAALRARKPALIHCAISGYGRHGEWAGRPTYDHVVQAASGMTLLAGQPDDGPIKVGFPAVDSVSGILAALALIAAIRRRDLTGLGESIDVSMFAAAMQLMYPMAVEALATGAAPPRVGNVGYSGSPGAETFACRDGLLALGANTPQQMLALARVLKIEAQVGPLLQGQVKGFVGAGQGAALRQLIAHALATESAGAMEQALNAAQVPAARVRDLGQAVRDGEACGLLEPWTLDGDTPVRVPGLGFRAETLFAGRSAPGKAAAPEPPRDAVSGGQHVVTHNPLIAPSQQGLMVGFPPPSTQRITAANSHLPQHLGWRILNSNRLFPMARISRGEGPIVPLPRGPGLDVASLSVDDGEGRVLPMSQVWHRTGADATLVLHRGRVVHESYLGDMSATRQHPMFSCTKSVVGLLVERLIHDGAIDPSAPAASHVPELLPSPVGSATVRQLLDMQANFMFSDRPKVAGEVQVDYIMGLGFIPRPPDYQGPNGVYELLTRARPMGGHGGAFRYDNGSTDALGWILRRLTQRSLDELISQLIWSGLGAEQDAGMMVDAGGTEWAAAGMGACLRDFARLGEMLRCRGRFNGRQLVPEAVFDSILAGGDRAAFAGGDGVPAGGSYKSQFWFYHDRHDSHACRGQYGQRLWIAPAAEIVIAQFSIDPHLAALEPLRLRGYQAVADALS